MLYPHATLNCSGRLLSLETPQVMGILNITPDSFFEGSRVNLEAAILRRAAQLLEEGAAILDIGGMSTRPGAEMIPVEEERRRVLAATEPIARRFPEAILSVDTFRAEVVSAAFEAGASIVNDISAGKLDAEMYPTVAALGMPYVLMHMQGTPQTMHLELHYENLVLEILDFFIAEVASLRALGVKDIVLDPGFGFGKKISHNFELLQQMQVFTVLDLPLLAGISRKSMIYKTLKTTPEGALNGTTALHMVALQQGARILRVHDVKPAIEVIHMWRALYNS